MEIEKLEKESRETVKRKKKRNVISDKKNMREITGHELGKCVD